MAFEALWQARRDGILDAQEFSDDDKVVAAYKKGVAKGMLKVMAKMGISTLQSYKGAQIFEAVGLRDEVIDKCFTKTASRVQGVSFDVLAEETLRRHALGYPVREDFKLPTLPNPGEFHWRADGEKHGWTPDRIANLQRAGPDPIVPIHIINLATEVNEENRSRCTLRGLLDFKQHVAGNPVPIEEVEPAQEIVKRFCTGAHELWLDLGRKAHETLAIAMNRLGGKSNTGEGGEDPERFKTLPNGDSKRSAIKQIASGRFWGYS